MTGGYLQQWREKGGREGKMEGGREGRRKGGPGRDGWMEGWTERTDGWMDES